MNTEFRKSFARDLKKIKDGNLLRRVREVILQVEEADDIHDVRQLKKLVAEGNFYRIRMGDYRIGLVIEEDTVRFVRLLHRKDIYRFFP